MTRRAWLAGVLALAAACREGEAPRQGAPIAAASPVAPTPTSALVTGPGVEVADRTIRVGVLGAGEGAHEVGLRLAARVSGGLLPGGWKIELVERDTGGDLEAAAAAYADIGARVLYLGLSSGAEATLAIADELAGDGLVAFAAPPSARLADQERVVTVLPPPSVEVMRAVDAAVADADGASAVRAAIVYSDDGRGAEALAGFRRAAAHHGLALASEHPVNGAIDGRALVGALAAAEVSHVIVAVAPPELAELVDAAAAARYRPLWLGTTASWTDYFFSPVSAAEPAALARFRWVTGLPYWGEDVPGMNLFLAAWDRHGAALGEGADFGVLSGYVAGLAQLEALRRAIDAGDLSRAGFLRALRSIDDFDAGGLIPPVDLSRGRSVQTRVLAPDFATRSWRVAAGWGAPAALRSDR